MANSDAHGKELSDKSKQSEKTSSEDAELIAHIMREQYSGPLPLPQHFEEYERICPGAADRILTLAERQTAHRHSLEGKDLDARIDDRKTVRNLEKRGQGFGFLIGVVAIIAGAMVAIRNPAISGSLAGGFISCSGIATIVGAFIYGRKSTNWDENEGKTDEQ